MAKFSFYCCTYLHGSYCEYYITSWMNTWCYLWFASTKVNQGSTIWVKYLTQLRLSGTPQWKATVRFLICKTAELHSVLPLKLPLLNWQQSRQLKRPWAPVTSHLSQRWEFPVDKGGKYMAWDGCELPCHSQPFEMCEVSLQKTEAWFVSKGLAH